MHKYDNFHFINTSEISLKNPANTLDIQEFWNLAEVSFIIHTLLLVMLLVELRNTCKKIEQKNAWKTPHLLYFWFKGVKYDILMCQSHSTLPQPIQPRDAKQALYVIISAEIPEN